MEIFGGKFFYEKSKFFGSYEVEFSKPKNMKPIPEGTVKVYFSVIEAEGGANEVEFNFENESLKHRPGNTMRSNMYEVSRKIPLTVIFSELDKQRPREKAQDQDGAASWHRVRAYKVRGP